MPVLKNGFCNMEIYKAKITDLRQGVKNQNRLNVFVDGKYSFSLDIAQVVDLGVKVGKLVTPEELDELKKASEFGKLYQRALEWVLVRPRSERETNDYLVRKLYKSSSDALGPAHRPCGSSASQGAVCYGRTGAPSLLVSRERSSEDIVKFASQIIERLVARGYLDDVKFAEWYVENRFVKKGVSAQRLKMELMKKGVSKEIIEEVLRGSERNDEEEARKIIAKKRAKYTDEKLIQYLCRQGFPYELVSELVRSCEMD